MEFNEKLHQLRKHKGLTQEELADILFVSRTAVSKWESGRGYPNIDSLKEIANYFNVSIDSLLSSDELLCLAEEDSRQKQQLLCDLVFGSLDCSAAMVFFLPFFGQETGGQVLGVSLLNLSEISLCLKSVYGAFLIGMAVAGIAILLLRNYSAPLWTNNKYKMSLFLNVLTTLLFIISSQPYAATFLFVFLIIKAMMLIK